jgi:phosphoribosylaminoimidazole (AIR) synthetase
VARAAGRIADAAADLVYHGANDLLVHGARPLAFLDYVAQARLDPPLIADAVAGLSRACVEVGAVLLGGETAEMPDTYLPDVVDVAGCMIGCVERDALLDGTRVQPGDRVLGLAANGLHTNGFSLARRVVERSGVALGAPLPGGAGTLSDALLAPHAMAHVTGGGIAGNLVRVLPEGCGARLDASAWTRPPLMRWLVEQGDVPEDDARRTLNLGIGFVLVVAAGHEGAVRAALESGGETVYAIGAVTAGPRAVAWEDEAR